MMARLAAATTMPKTIMIDATCLNAHRMGSSLRTKVRWIASASLGQRQLVINFHRHGHPGALHAKSAGRRRLSPGSASPHSGQLGRAIPGGGFALMPSLCQGPPQKEGVIAPVVMTVDKD